MSAVSRTGSPQSGNSRSVSLRRRTDGRHAQVGPRRGGAAGRPLPAPRPRQASPAAGRNRPQTLRHRLTPHPRMPVARQPARSAPGRDPGTPDRVPRVRSRRAWTATRSPSASTRFGENVSSGNAAEYAPTLPSVCRLRSTGPASYVRGPARSVCGEGGQNRSGVAAVCRAVGKDLGDAGQIGGEELDVDGLGVLLEALGAAGARNGCDVLARASSQASASRAVVMPLVPAGLFTRSPAGPQAAARSSAGRRRRAGCWRAGGR